jgi:hypothetical protein
MPKEQATDKVVAQICNLLYRRFATCSAPTYSRALLIAIGDLQTVAGGRASEIPRESRTSGNSIPEGMAELTPYSSTFCLVCYRGFLGEGFEAGCRVPLWNKN